MTKIEPLIDKYGSLARESFIADYLEVVALRSGRVKLSSLRDLIADTYPRIKQILNSEDGEGADQDWSPVLLAEEAWTCVLQRSELLGDKYPFVITGEVLKFDSGIAPLESPYLSLLAITVAHAFTLMPSNDAEHLLEDVVGDSLENVGFKVGRMAPLSRSNRMQFEATMEALGASLNIPTNANAAVRRTNANDEDVDLVAHIDWGTSRFGRWMFIGQVTCAVSDSWRAKAQEPSVNDWQRFFGEVVPPTAFLAVPHHANDIAFRYVTSKEVNILDRPRIVSNLVKNSQGQKEAVQALLDAEYASFKV